MGRLGPGPTPIVTYTYRGDGLRSTKTVTTNPTITYTWDVNPGLPEVLQDGTLPTSTAWVAW